MALTFVSNYTDGTKQSLKTCGVNSQNNVCIRRYLQL